MSSSEMVGAFQGRTVEEAYGLTNGLELVGDGVCGDNVDNPDKVGVPENQEFPVKRNSEPFIPQGISHPSASGTLGLPDFHLTRGGSRVGEEGVKHDAPPSK
jgi:hypothetical protein